jgi:hypothetical protein
MTATAGGAATWRQRAEEMRTLAEDMLDAECRARRKSRHPRQQRRHLCRRQDSRRPDRQAAMTQLVVA